MAILAWASIALLSFLAYVSLDVMGFGFFDRKGKEFQVEGRTVLLTGGSYGLGREIASRLSARGANLVLVARNLEKLEECRDHVKTVAKNPSTQRFHIISADVTVEAENERILAEATEWNNGQVPEIIWANAGSAKPNLFLDSTIEDMRHQMEINYWASAYLAHKALKAWLYPSTPYKPQEKGAKPQPPRHLIITASSLAFVSVAGYSPYSPAKAGLRALIDALRYELLLYNGARRSKKSSTDPKAPQPAPFDVHIHGIYPGGVATPGMEKENATKPRVTHILEETDPIQSIEVAAGAAFRGLDRGLFMIPTNYLGELMRVSVLGSSPREFGLVRDTVLQWITSVAWLFISPDMDGKAWGYGKKEGMPALATNEKK